MMASSPEAMQFYQKGAEHYRKGEHTAAVESFQRTLEADPRFYRAWAYLGMAYAELGRLDAAVQACRKCIEIEPSYHKAINNVGELYRRKGHLDMAAMVFKMATEADSAQPSYFYNLGITYAAIGMRPQAEEALGRAAALAPADYAVASELAQAQFSQGKHAAAEAVLTKFVEANPNHDHIPEIRARLAYLRRQAAALPGR